MKYSRLATEKSVRVPFRPHNPRLDNFSLFQCSPAAGPKPLNPKTEASDCPRMAENLERKQAEDQIFAVQLYQMLFEAGVYYNVV